MTSETVIYQTTQRNNPEDSNLRLGLLKVLSWNLPAGNVDNRERLYYNIWPLA
jgi:hypothetical protein